MTALVLPAALVAAVAYLLATRSRPVVLRPVLKVEAVAPLHVAGSGVVGIVRAVRIDERGDLHVDYTLGRDFEDALINGEEAARRSMTATQEDAAAVVDALFRREGISVREELEP